ncbi:peroxiredoxin-like family protein [Metabacillus iocasae]|uniref:thioredoxin-dependent peroxiredoxin n=1 Tax=Priestia iocasae TaxID=2291674 RepID=A0ABS2QWN5_9BACI|nr:peroxiredoxin-like family protein [Metabacillus iocasae]MBM7703888.1 peroxiredoxin [Metabacillus iocasae]
MTQSTLQKQFAEYIESFKKRVPQEKQDLMKKAIDELEQSNESKGLRVGDKAPTFALPNALNDEVKLHDLLAKGPVIVTFYRGGWCPYCNMELRAYQGILDEIHEAGGELVAISPQTPDQSLNTKEKSELNFHVLSDVGNKVAQEFDLVYRLPDYLIDLYKEFGLRVDEHNADDSWTLPVSATYIIAQDGTIAYEYAKADYKDRVEPSDVLNELKKVTAK